MSLFQAISTFARFLFTRTTKDWRLHRSACRALLTKVERASDVEEAKL